MKLQTKYSGELEYTEKELLRFPQGIFGFESETEFVLIHFSDDNDDLLCLQSTRTPGLAFVVMNPFSLDHDYQPQPGPEDIKRVHAALEEELNYYVICVVREDAASSTVNLKCPLIINPKTNLGSQIILNQEEYRLRHFLTDFSSGAPEDKSQPEKEGGGAHAGIAKEEK